MKKVRLTRKNFVEYGKKVLIIHPFDYKISESVWQAGQEGILEITECVSIEEYVNEKPEEGLEIYDGILVLRDKTVWGGKGMFEWSRFIRNNVEGQKENMTEQIIYSMRMLSYPECICFLKEGNYFVYKKDKVLKK